MLPQIFQRHALPRHDHEHPGRGPHCRAFRWAVQCTAAQQVQLGHVDAPNRCSKYPILLTPLSKLKSIAQGLPLGSGMGSSAASAAAGAWAVNALFGEPFSRADLVPAGLEAESIVSGYHADNIAPALMGGFVLIRRAPRLATSC